MLEDKEVTHESFAQMSIHRVQSARGETMYGSDLKHSTFIRMDLFHSSHRRGLSHNWYHAEKLIASVEMSQNQFSELITSMNMGDGVPVTLKRTERDGEMENPVLLNVADLHKDEFKETVKSITKDSAELLNKMKTVLGGSGTVKKADRNELIHDLEMVLQGIQSNMPYMENCFDEAMDNVVTDAKGTIEAFYQKRVIDAGLKALDGSTPSSPSLIEKDE